MSDRVQITVSTEETFEVDAASVYANDPSYFVHYRMDDPDCPAPLKRDRRIVSVQRPGNSSGNSND